MNDVDLNCRKENIKSTLFSVEILSFNIWSNELSIPGTVDFAISLNVTKKLSNDIQLSTKFQRKLGSTWIHLPCLTGAGACDKQSLCDLIQRACKTNSFIQSNRKDNKTSCSCDLDTGIYTIEHIRINLTHKKTAKLVKPITPGQYRLQMSFLKGKANDVVGCVVGYLTLFNRNKYS